MRSAAGGGGSAFHTNSKSEKVLQEALMAKPVQKEQTQPRKRMLSNNELPSSEINQFKTELRYVIPKASCVEELVAKKAIREIEKTSKDRAATPISVKLLRLRPSFDLNEFRREEEGGGKVEMDLLWKA